MVVLDFGFKAQRVQTDLGNDITAVLSLAGHFAH
jgi:hypothetical protein